MKSIVRNTLLVVAVWAGFEACQPNLHREGERLYKAHCANCHMDDGTGLGALIPPLTGSDHLGAQRAKWPCIVKYGLSDTIRVNGKTYAEKMPGVPALSEIQITNLLNYLQNKWAPQTEPFRLEEVQALLGGCVK